MSTGDPQVDGIPEHPETNHSDESQESDANEMGRFRSDDEEYDAAENSSDADHDQAIDSSFSSENQDSSPHEEEGLNPLDRENLANATDEGMPPADVKDPEDISVEERDEALESPEEDEDNMPAAAVEPKPRKRRKKVETAVAVEEDDDVEAPPDEEFQWFVLKVASNREKTVKQAIERRVKIAGIERFVKDILVLTEAVTEFKDGKKRVIERKLYPGYVFVHLVLNEETWFVIRETLGVSDFAGANGKPLPMPASEVERMLGRTKEAEVEAPRLEISFQTGDRVKIKEGTFENFEGDVDEVIESKGKVRVMIHIFGRPTPVELEYWQVEPL